MAFLLYLGAISVACAAPIDCGPAPDVKCLAAEVFALAKMLPAEDFFRRHVAFAERELAPGDIKTALEFVGWDSPDPPPWEDIDWMARAGRFDQALKQATQRQVPTERLGGLLAVATRLLDKHDPARAQKIVEEVERQLPSISSDDEYAGPLSRDAGGIWARLGQTDRAARLMSGASIESVSALLDVASQSPAGASLRVQAWREAERVNEPFAWRLLVEDATKRGDPAEASRAAQAATKALDGAIGDDRVSQVISLARAVLAAGLPELSAKLIKPWPQWINGKEAIRQSNIVNDLVPVLAGLARDQDIETAAHNVSDVADRSQCLNKAAEVYFRLGRSDVAEKFDTEALALAISSPTADRELQWSHDAALQNLALVRAGHGDILGALDVAGELRDETKIHEATLSIAANAIYSGYGPVARPAIEALEQQAKADQNARLLLHAAKDWHEVGEQEFARQRLAEAMMTADEHHSPLVENDLGDAAELMWRLNGAGKAESMTAIVDKLAVNDPGAIDRLVEIITPISPAVAVQLTGRQTEVYRQIDELANIAIQIGTGAK